MANILSSKKPQYPWAWYADGSMCEIRELKPYNYQGVEGTMFVLRPSVGTTLQYGLKRGLSMTAEGLIRRWYPNTEYHVLREGINGRFFVTTNLDGEHTNFSRREIYYTQQIEGLSKQVKILQSEIAALYQSLDNMGARADVFYQGLVDRIKLIATVRGSIDEIEAKKNKQNET